MAFEQYKYQNQYNKDKYDRCIFNVPKGKKEIIEQHWKKKGYKSLNAYINDLIEKDMNHGKTTTIGKVVQKGVGNTININ